MFCTTFKYCRNDTHSKLFNGTSKNTCSCTRLEPTLIALQQQKHAVFFGFVACRSKEVANCARVAKCKASIFLFLNGLVLFTWWCLFCCCPGHFFADS